jgi:hypothetical protein
MGAKDRSRCPHCAELQQENARLKNLLVAHNIPLGERSPDLEPTPCIEASTQNYSPEEKIALFRRLFRGRSMSTRFVGNPIRVRGAFFFPRKLNLLLPLASPMWPKTGWTMPKTSAIRECPSL